ncbi:MAG: DUF5329 family protein [Deltaproteobacteria bacterium]|jgi:hypothetical protein|nr:DUF5329 family protein [Deltaproteobacteria bacterium]
MKTLVLLAALLAGWLLVGSGLAEALPASELTRVYNFLDLLGQENDLIFIRNGREFKVAKAVAHLKRKLNAVAKRLQTAEEFIDQVASTSSSSGRPYLIRRPGRPNAEAKEFFHELLREADRKANLKADVSPDLKTDLQPEPNLQTKE